MSTTDMLIGETIERVTSSDLRVRLEAFRNLAENEIKLYGKIKSSIEKDISQLESEIELERELSRWPNAGEPGGAEL